KQVLAILLIVLSLTAIASVVVYNIWKTHKARGKVGYQEVSGREDSSFEMMSLDSREGISMVLPQGY
ncbi:unnamed protein product, partial [Choristocarpus tenellus]